MVRKRNGQHSSCPQDWLKDGIKVPVHLTVRQEQYAARAVGIARSVFNLMVATHRSARAQGHGLWPSPMELEKQFNDLKHEPGFGMEYATEVSKFVAQGACRDFRRAYENWRNPTLNAERPTFKKKNRIGTGAFLAASGVDRVKYDDHRRIRLPYLGSVKLKRELPEGIPYEVRIKQENGRWYASVNYWKPPVDAEEKTHLCGAVDVGITPLAVDSELVHYENPKALYRMLAKLQRWQRTLARRTVGSRGWHEAQGRINAIHRRIKGLRDNAHHQVSRQLVRKYAVLAIESLNVAGMPTEGHPRCRYWRVVAEDPLQGGTIVVEADRCYPSSKLCSEPWSLGRELHWTGNAHHHCRHGQEVRRAGHREPERGGHANCPIRPRPSVMPLLAGCCRRSATRQIGTAPSSWKRTAAIRRANSAPTAALTMRVWGGNCTGPAHSAAGDTIATKMPRSIC